MIEKYYTIHYPIIALIVFCGLSYCFGKFKKFRDVFPEIRESHHKFMMTYILIVVSLVWPILILIPIVLFSGWFMMWIFSRLSRIGDI